MKDPVIDLIRVHRRTEISQTIGSEYHFGKPSTSWNGMVRHTRKLFFGLVALAYPPC
jgi:hypothetical protein